MIKKTPYEALYYSAVPEARISDLKAKNLQEPVDILPTTLLMDKYSIYGIVATVWADSEDQYHMWPRRFDLVKPKPYLMYCKWELALLQKPVLAIVGPRELSSYGQEVLEELFRHLQHFNVVTVSGMAPWADTLCHELSMKYGIPTIAVLGGGFSYFLHGRKRLLMESIVSSGGLILSEYKHLQEPTSRTFPQRNRIIAGIADAIFLPEAKIDSGSLLTVDEGIKRGKPIGAPMNSIFLESSEWTNKYISQWRIAPICNILSFVEKHFTRVSERKEEIHVDMSDDEARIMKLFSDKRAVSIWEIASHEFFDAPALMMHLSMLEMKWVIAESSPWVYVRKI